VSKLRDSAFPDFVRNLGSDSTTVFPPAGVNADSSRNTESKHYGISLRLIKLIGSLVYFFLQTTLNAVRRAFGKPIPGTLVILCYHAIPRRHRSRFGKQMEVALTHAAPARLEGRIQLRPGDRRVAITFDDAYQSTLQNALPELEQRRIPCTIFVISHMAGQTPWWAGSSGYDPEEQFATLDQLASLPEEWVTIGSHTMTHPDLAELSSESLKNELAHSRELLEERLDREVSLLAFPHGFFNKKVVEFSRAAGYSNAFSIEPDVITASRSSFVIGRVIVDPTDWGIEFRLKLLGGYGWLATVYRMKRRFRSALNRI
jgi:peptidoglycan/xylan/chitin deacetylase (PgdA/CDA1 family)